MRLRRFRPTDDDGATHWSRWARQSLAEIERRDARGLSRLRQGYSGIGSFNDLVLDGDGVEDGRRRHDELDVLRGRIDTSVTALLVEHRRAEA